MQEIVYKLVPGLQERKFFTTCCLICGEFLHGTFIPKKGTRSPTEMQLSPVLVKQMLLFIKTPFSFYDSLDNTIQIPKF